jgi:hypothetical protein
MTCILLLTHELGILAKLKRPRRGESSSAASAATPALKSELEEKRLLTKVGMYPPPHMTCMYSPPLKSELEEKRLLSAAPNPARGKN